MCKIGQTNIHGCICHLFLYHNAVIQYYNMSFVAILIFQNHDHALMQSMIVTMSRSEYYYPSNHHLTYWSNNQTVLLVSIRVNLHQRQLFRSHVCIQFISIHYGLLILLSILYDSNCNVCVRIAICFLISISHSINFDPWCWRSSQLICFFPMIVVICTLWTHTHTTRLCKPLFYGKQCESKEKNQRKSDGCGKKMGYQQQIKTNKLT